MKAWLGVALIACAACGDADTGVSSNDPDLVNELQAAQLDAVTQGLAVTGSYRPGDVLPAQASFQYYELEGTYCRDGSRAGVTVKRGSSDKVLVYLQGGGGCFNTQTCLEQVNPSRIAENRRAPGAGGIFASRADNPLNDYSVAYVPYCTGDFMIGNKINSVPFGPQNQRFVGRKNLELILKSVTATFPGATKVVLSGSSAGGAAASGNVAPVKAAYPAAQLYVINDAGPVLSAGNNFLNDYFPTGQQTKLKNLWGLSDTILKDCGADCNVANWFPAAVKRLSGVIGRKPALVCGKQDIVVAVLFGNMRADQYPLIGFFGVEMRDALNDYRSRMGNTWSTYYVTTPNSLAQQHMFLLDETFYTTSQQVVGSSAKKSIRDWVADYLNDAPIPAVGP
jgi:hypothetical protein